MAGPECRPLNCKLKGQASWWMLAGSRTGREISSSRLGLRNSSLNSCVLFMNHVLRERSHP
jgi:hypothetical protein